MHIEWSEEKFLKGSVHPKILIEVWIICLDPVSANSEKGSGSEWAVRVGQRVPSRFGQSGAAREMNLVQIVVEAPQLGGVCQALSRHRLFLAGTARNVLVDYREGQAIRPHE